MTSEVEYPLVAAVLVFVRMGAAVALLPTLGGGFVKLSAALAATIALAPALAQRFVPPGPVGLVLLGLREGALGLALGLLASAVLHGIQAAGHLVDWTLDPRTTSGPVRRLYGLLALLLFFTTGAHRTVLRALAESYVALPLGRGETDMGIVSERAIEAVARLFASALAFAAPLMLVAIAVDLTIAIAARLLPRLHAFFLLAPARVLVLLLALAGSIVSLTPVMSAALRRAAQETLEGTRDLRR